MDPPNVTNEAPKEEQNGVTPDREKKRSSRKSKDEKSGRKKDERSIDVVMKSLNSVSDPVEKIQLLSKKYAELHEYSKKDAATVKEAEKKLIMLQREKDSLQQDQTKSVLARNRLEELCRELQRQNKAMKEESTQRAREEDEKRKEVSSKFQATLSEINSLMQQNSESNSKLRDENLEMQKQLKAVWEQYGLREQQAEKMTKQIKLEGQLAEAKITKAKLEFEAQREILERDKAELGSQLALCQARCTGHEKTEEALRAQISVYYEKYEEFQNVLTKSNSVYSDFKSEMEKMSKKITRLEKDTSTWKQKWESTHKALLALAVEKKVKDDEVALQARQLEKMQKLCRTLIIEKASLEKANGKKSDDVANDCKLIEDTIAAHMAVNDFVVSKTMPQDSLPNTQPHKTKEKKASQKKNDSAKVLKTEGVSTTPGEPVEIISDLTKKEETAVPEIVTQNNTPKNETSNNVKDLKPKDIMQEKEDIQLNKKKGQESNVVPEKMTTDIVTLKLDAQKQDTTIDPKPDKNKEKHDTMGVKNDNEIISQNLIPNESDVVSQVSGSTEKSKPMNLNKIPYSSGIKTANSVKVVQQVDESVKLSAAEMPVQKENIIEGSKKETAAPVDKVPLEEKPKSGEIDSNLANKETSPNRVVNKQSKLPCLVQKEKSPLEKVEVEVELATGSGDAPQQVSSATPSNSPEQPSSTSPPPNKSNSDKKTKDGRRRTKKK